MPLDRKNIVAAGLRVLEEGGLDGLTVRRIADELGVQAPALYWHVGSRGELLGLMAEELLRQVLDSLDPEAIGGAFLLQFARAIARQQAERRDVARLIASCGPTESGYLQVRTRIHARLEAGGVADPSGALMAVFAFTLGWSLFAANPAMKAHLASAMSPERTFEAGLKAIVAGFGCDPAG